MKELIPFKNTDICRWFKALIWC